MFFGVIWPGYNVAWMGYGVTVDGHCLFATINGFRFPSMDHDWEGM